MSLLRLENISRCYHTGESEIFALRNIYLSIDKGEFVSIVGSSGSGKSTLMNILGCLDRPTTGMYRVAGYRSTSLSDDEVSQLRREYFGFIFQSYHLIAGLDAQANVELPALYAGTDSNERHTRSTQLLTYFGLAERLHHRPTQLSGGQQQRVSIARALMNGGNVILADEPTGALDSRSGQEVLNVLRILKHKGHTIIMVTHDSRVAAHADRIIELEDGRILSDTLDRKRRLNQPPEPIEIPPISPSFEVANKTMRPHSIYAQTTESIRTAIKTLVANKLRSGLTALGIIIGIASVVSIVTLGEGMRNAVLKSFYDIANTAISISPGAGESDDRSASIRTLNAADVEAISKLPYIKSVTPKMEVNVRLRRSRYDIAGSVRGSGSSGLKNENTSLLSGRDFSHEDLQTKAQVAIIDSSTQKRLFPDGKDPLGVYILVGMLPCQIVGIVKDHSNEASSGNPLVKVWLPYTTVSYRVLGKNYFDGIAVGLKKNTSSIEVASALTQFLSARHGSKDFYISNNEETFAALQKTTLALTLGLGCVGGISLLVGGIGVMNIMLVSVSERTREIGIRRAVGARQRDIFGQFLIESILLCMLGGLVGMGLGAVTCKVASSITDVVELNVSWFSMVVALMTCLLVGIGFGVIPAKRAARLDPIVALARE